MSDASPGWSALLSGKNAIYSLPLAGGMALHAINVFIATTILPSVVRDIGGLDYYAWSTTLFVLASILGAALSARLLQGAGPRGAYGVAALVFAAGTVICALAPSMPVLLVGRFVQGWGGGFLHALAYAVIRLVLPEALWARAIGLISAMWGIATLIGPAVGGIFAELGAWRAAFWSLAPVVLAFAALAFASLPKRQADAQAQSPLPLLQLALLTAAVLALSAGSVATAPMWNAVGVLGALILVVLLLAGRSAHREAPSAQVGTPGVGSASHALRDNCVPGDRHPAGNLCALFPAGAACANPVDRRLPVRSASGRMDVCLDARLEPER
jgi:MFS family permease